MPKLPDLQKPHWQVGDSVRCPQCGVKGICYHKDQLNKKMNEKYEQIYGDPMPDFMLDGKIWRDDLEKAKTQGIKLSPYQALEPGVRHDLSSPSPRNYGEWKLVWEPRKQKQQGETTPSRGGQPTTEQGNNSTLPRISSTRATTRMGLKETGHSNAWTGEVSIHQRVKMLDSLAPVDVNEAASKNIDSSIRDSSSVQPFVTAAWKHVVGGSRFLSPEVPDLYDERRQWSMEPEIRIRSKRDVLDCIKHVTKLQKRPKKPLRRRKVV